MSKRILVVEDQPDNRQIIRDMLAPADYTGNSPERSISLSRVCRYEINSAIVMRCSFSRSAKAANCGLTLLRD
jgi:CheY-like chemotaxis protein